MSAWIEPSIRPRLRSVIETLQSLLPHRLRLLYRHFSARAAVLSQTELDKRAAH